MRCATWLVLLLPTMAHAVEPRVVSAKTQVVVGQWDAGLVVKWSDALHARTTDSGEVRLPSAARSSELDHVIQAFGLQFEPWINQPEAQLRALELRAQAHSNRAQPDLASLHRVHISDPTPERLQTVADALYRLDAVEFVAGDIADVPPPGDIAPETPDLTPNQGWIESDPGVDARAAWDWGLTGAGIRMSDCEYGWHHGHEDLVDGALEPESGQTVAAGVASRGWDHHGTAVAGELFGQHNRYGVDGLAPEATLATYSEWTEEEGFRRGTAISNAIRDSAVGDVVLLEMQAGGPDGRYAPAETNQAVWTVVRLGVDAGVVIVGAAGNGAANLDSAPYDTYRSWGDSGAILVGAGSSNVNHSRLGFSTYGDRVNVQGWGQNVFTTGYGGFARYGGDNNQAYTSSFSGTSSASPFVAGSATLLQEMALRYQAMPLGPRELRQLLIDTGVPEAPGANIGPLPDLDAALSELEARLDVPPAIVSVDNPTPLNEGESAVLSVDVQMLPIHEGQVWWIQDGIRTDGRTLTLDAVDDGEIALTVHVEDDWARSATQTVSVVVNNLPPSIQFAQAAGDPLEGSGLTLQVSATDPGVNDRISYEWAVDGELFGTGVALEWTPADDGTYAFEVVAFDDDGARSEPEFFTVVVEDVVANVAIDGPEQVSRKTDAEFIVSVVDPGLDTHSIEWQVDGEPAGTDPSLIVQWKDKGVHEVRVVVTDEDGVRVDAATSVEVVPRGGCGCSASASPVGAAVVGLGLFALWGRRRRS